MTRKTVLLLFGGESSEHDVSIMGARNVYAAMDGDKYQVLLCYIDRQGKWWLLDSWQDSLSQHGGVQLLVAPGSGSLMTLPGNTIIHPHHHKASNNTATPTPPPLPIAARTYFAFGFR